MKLLKNVRIKKYTYLVTFKDGRKEEITVEAESPSSAFLLLPEGVKKAKLI